MSTLRATVAVAATLLALGTAACSLPPFTTSEQSFSVKYSMFIPSAAQGVPLVAGLPEFNDQKAPPTTIPVPKEAKTVKLSSVILNLKLVNTGPLPLRMKIYLSPESVDPYTTPALGGETAQIDVPRGGGEVKRELPIDPALLQQNALKLGYTFGSPGTAESVTFQDADQVTVTQSIRVVAKLF